MEIFLDNMKPSRSSWRFISLLGLLALLSSRRTAIALAAAKIPVRSFVTATPKFAVRGGSSSVLHATIEEIDTKGPTNPSTFHSSEIVATDSTENRGPLKVLFLSADTGGGHRASAESLAVQFQNHFPGSTYDFIDVWEDGVFPYRTLVESYKHLSAHPRQWRILYHLSNSRPWEIVMDWHSTLMCERRMRRRIEDYDPDVVVSVHPAMNNCPIHSIRKISEKKGKHIPFFTVVTDLASGHCTWFQKNVEKIYVASNQLNKKARRRGRTPEENIIMSGLPIRNDFAVQAENIGDRTTPKGKEYQKQMKTALDLDPAKPMVLVMGGGEGVGSLSDIVDELYTSFSKRGVDASICVVCGRNEKLKASLAAKDWGQVLARERRAKKGRFSFFRRKKRREMEDSLEDPSSAERGNVDVIGLGFITNMADYMVAADILVSKAGPGTIAEAAAVGLPVMLTSFLPGQEAGNVDFVLEKGFGDYYEDPVEISEGVASWLQDDSLLNAMSLKAQEAGVPHAAADIVLDIGSRTHDWIMLNEYGFIEKEL